MLNCPFAPLTMSNYPPTPSFAGPHYTPPQWPPSNPTPSSSMPSLLPHHHFPYIHNQTAVPPSHPEGAALPGNQDSHMANSHLPGLGGPGAPGQIPPPLFGFMAPFTSSPFPPPPFPPIQMPPLRYPSIPAPSAPAMHQSGYTPNEPQPRLGQEVSTPADSQVSSTSNSNMDLDREEGELTDGDELPSQPKGSETAAASSRPPKDVQEHLKANGKVGSTRGYSRNLPNANISNTSTSSVPISSKDTKKEGLNVTSTESSMEGLSSSRSSGSPYNPALTIRAESPCPNNIGLDGAAMSSLLSDNTYEPANNEVIENNPDRLWYDMKPTAQLRVQAQGALLSLAPHNIRYNELVREGIDPLVLRQLYEDVGIKIPTPQPDVESNSPASAGHGLDQPVVKVATSPKGAAQQDPMNVVVSPPPSTQQAVTGKPMERKEVIARMLAAKAAKTSTSTPSQTEAAKETIPSSSSNLPDAGKTTTLPSRDAPTLEKEARVKEKNKAQTELARQRIEQLKKQGLMRTLQKSQPDSTPSEPNEEHTYNTDTTQATNLTPIQHPLPERPPDPEFSPQSRIPGLFMTESQEPAITEESNAAPVQHVADIDTQTRTNQRKRPRASDFDEPIPMPKKSFGNGSNHVVAEPARLIIDISDDEFYGDDENDSMDVDTLAGNVSQDVERLLRSTPMTTDSLPQRPATSLSQGFSTSVTPNGRNYDQEHQEHLRRKDLEIKAMHRRIAELEERKKAKLAASRTQSPRALDLPTPLDDSVTANVAIHENTNVNQVPKLDEATSKLMDQSSSLPKDALKLEEMRAKLLRKQEIESGIPALDHEINKSEARLAEVNQEQNSLLSQITKGKEGRQQLLHELEALGQELQDVTLDDIELALRQVQTEEPADAELIATTHELPPRPITDQVPEATNAQVPVHNEGVPATDYVSASDAAVSNAEHEKDTVMDDADEEQMATSSSDSMSSSMDESSDSDSESDDSASVASEESVARSSAPATAETETQNDRTQDTEQETPAESDLDGSSLKQSQLTNAESQVNVTSDEHMEGSAPEVQDRGSRESSVSDAYEPPEPELTASPAGSAYSPPFSPASPAPIEPTDDSEFPSNEVTKASEPLTENDQGLAVHQPRSYARISPLDNERDPYDSLTTFTQYDSPLKHFKAYRYHPSYVENVANGYRSLTYSHNIDPMKYLCPFEAAGGVCNDRSCEFQHFRDMSLSGASTDSSHYSQTYPLMI
ncbi:uncharacterized protein BO72DRAFT_186311 [Aspergillus fijiensis CBS 313.89]|uniref:Putative zinc-finger domain-containing protein n=1 Tax=Aspergillus fijiensis CBS 313.89 TaxID=1448319 RepID=A0A8G1RMU7_9EURO|nr:uncharacterized protein BO72DRAFT_186311 [Aspergillus fijiensis CBS 313.89]RAK75068.1 hypothetical protein BO72DRAFT_186311 [Aspergillus fijiensis CBS 313.89]